MSLLLSSYKTALFSAVLIMILALAWHTNNNNKTDSLIEKLEEKSADKEEVRALRKEFVGKVNQTLTPIKEEIEKQRERNKRNSNVGIQ